RKLQHHFLGALCAFAERSEPCLAKDVNLLAFRFGNEELRNESSALLVVGCDAGRVAMRYWVLDENDWVLFIFESLKRLNEGKILRREIVQARYREDSGALSLKGFELPNFV